MRKVWPDKALRRPRGVVLVLHGGAETNHDPVPNRSGALWRARQLANAIKPRLRADQIAVTGLRFDLIGWNSPTSPSPVPDARWALDRLREEYAHLPSMPPIVLLGHSMGARVALAVADDADVVGVVGLAPWFPPDEAVTTIAGKHLIAAHGTRDKITSARDTQRLLERAGPIAASVDYVPMGYLGHYMLTHQGRWNRVAIDAVQRILAR